MKASYQQLDKTTLGMQGRLYPSDMVIEVRGADVPEIRAWSNINEKDPMSISKHVIDIITACVRVSSASGVHTYNVKDLYEHDKLALLMTIHTLTFADKRDTMMYVKAECSNEGCGKVFDQLAVTPANLMYKTPDEKYDKYIDAEKGCYVMPTKTYGEIVYRPSTIGLGNAMLSWSKTFKPQFVIDNQEMLKTVQSLVTDWRTANDKSLRKLQIEQYNNMDAKQLGFRSGLIDLLSIEVLDTLEYVCPDCGATFRCPLAIEGGYKGMFVPVQSVDDELL